MVYMPDDPIFDRIYAPGYQSSPQHAIVPVEVIRSQAAAREDQLRRAESGAKADAMIALGPVVVITPIVPIPEDIYATSIIPLDTQHPTARLTGDLLGGGKYKPWTTVPVALPFAAAALGSLLVVMGRQVIAEMAISGAEEWVNRAKKRYNQRGVQFRFMTGRSEAGSGNIIRPRGDDGSIPEGTDPYAEPGGPTWWQPWTWV